MYPNFDNGEKTFYGLVEYLKKWPRDAFVTGYHQDEIKRKEKLCEYHAATA